MKIINEYYNLNRINKKIVLISDIHYYDKSDMKLLNKILSKIEIIKPDFICIPGDITDIAFVKDEDDFIEWLTKLSLISKVVVTLGNHEYCVSKKEKKFELNEKLIKKISSVDNLYLLRNENIVLDNINFIGLDLGINYYFNNERVNVDLEKYVNQKYYNVLLCHSPVDIDSIIKNKPMNLVLCGHMHGGVVPRFLRPIFKNKGLISPTKKLFPKYAYGFKKIDNTDIITTSGIRVFSRINRFYLFKDFFSAEIVVI